MLGNPVAEVAREVDRVGAVQGARAVLLVQEFLHELVADHRQEVRIAHCAVLCLRDVNFILLSLFLGRLRFITTLIGYCF